MSRQAARAAVVACLGAVAACAHVPPPTPSEEAADVGAAAQLRRCFDGSDPCSTVAALMETKLRRRPGIASTHPPAMQIVRTLQDSEATPLLGNVTAQCRRGRQLSCRALWWAVDRLYFADDATVARANECALTRAIATAIDGGDDSSSGDR